MAARTASVSGNIHTPATLGGAVWADGDTLSINAGIAVSIAPSADIGVSGATGSTALTLAGAASEIILDGALVLRGDLSQARGAIVTGSAGGSLTFTPPVGSTYKWIIAAAGAGVAQINLTGTANSRVTITTTQGGGGNTYFDAATNDGVKLLWDYVTMSRFGDAATLGMNCTNGWITLPFNIQHTLFNYCGGIKLQYLGGATTADFIVDRVDFRNTLVTGSDEMFRFRHVNTFVSGTRSITNVTAYAAAGKTAHIVVTGATISKIYFYNVLPDAGADSGTIEKVFQITDNPSGVSSTIFGVGGGSNLTFQDSIHYTHLDNPHHIVEAGNAGLGKNTYRRCLVDGDDYFGTDGGDFVIPATECDILNNILINKAGTIATALSVATIVNARHNTTYRSMGLTIGETNGAATQAKDFKSNLFVSTINSGTGAAGGDGVHQDTTFSRQSAFTPDYNGWFGAMSAAAIAYMKFPVKTLGAGVTCTVGTTTLIVKAAAATFVSDGVIAGDFFWNTTRAAGARVLSVDSETQLTLATAVAAQVSGDTGTVRLSYWSTAGQKYGDDTRGLHDINADPGFVAPARTVASWNVVNGGVGTINAVAKAVVKLNGFDFDGVAAVANPADTIDNALAYTRAGFAPTNSIYRDAGHDGVTTGAVEGVFSSGAGIPQAEMNLGLMMAA